MSRGAWCSVLAGAVVVVIVSALGAPLWVSWPAGLVGMVAFSAIWTWAEQR